MGITGLLPFLENASKRCHITEFRGSVVAVDTYCWLHRGAYGCSERLFKGESTNAFVYYCMKYVRMLLSYDIRPIMVFDGRNLVAKLKTEKRRREQRVAHKKRATELLQEGKLNEARNEMKLSIDINHSMALAVIKECHKIGVDCIVAPYEADAQLAFLSMNGLVHFVVSEDSDLLLYGCKKVIYKMDAQGFGTLVDADDINLCMKLRPDKYTFEKFRHMCILSGCDYLDNLPGVGLKRALKFISLTENPNIYDVLLKIPSYLNLNVVVTTEYRNAFMVADATFKHQYVYDPLRRKQVRLTDVCQTNEEYCRHAGETLTDTLAFNLALGNVDPISLKMVDDWSPDRVHLKRTSIWTTHDHEATMFIVKKSPALNPPATRDIRIPVSPPSEQAKMEYDDKLNKELQYYKLIGPIKKKQKLDTVAEYPPVSETHIESTPIPFKRMKGNSKFEQTSGDTIETVTSRFFQSRAEESSKQEDKSPKKVYDSFLNEISQYSRKRCFENSPVDNPIIPESPLKTEENTASNSNARPDTPPHITPIEKDIKKSITDDVAEKSDSLSSMFAQCNVSKKRRMYEFNFGEDDIDDTSAANENRTKRAKTSTNDPEEEAKSPVISSMKKDIYKKTSLVKTRKKNSSGRQMNLLTMFQKMRQIE